jgi:transposase
VQPRDLYARILGLVDPWEVRDVRLDLKAGEVRVTVAAKLHASLRCPECRKPCRGYDSRGRIWRHLDTGQFMTILDADKARVECAEHGASRSTFRGPSLAPASRR